MIFLVPLHDMYYVFNLFIVVLDENSDADKAYRENIKAVSLIYTIIMRTILFAYSHLL